MRRTAAVRFSSTVIFLVVAASAFAQQVTVVATFDATNVQSPNGALVDYGAYLYGTTYDGGAQNVGSIYRIEKATGVLTTVLSFNGANGSYPRGGLMAYGSYFWGTTETGYYGYGTIFRFNPADDSLVTVKAFDSNNGSGPWSPPVEYAGYLYGTTSGGGGEGKSGTLYRLDPVSGDFATLVRFQYGVTTLSPRATPVVVGSSLYGTGAGYSVFGPVYKFDTVTGALTAVPWTNNSPEGAVAGLVQSGQHLFGVDVSGGFINVDLATGAATSMQGAPTFGFAYLSPDSYTACPNVTLVARGSYLYGLARGSNRIDGLGGVFRFDPSALSATVIAPYDGSRYMYGLSLMLSGSQLYGTTTGNSSNKATVIRCNPDPTPTVTTLQSSVDHAAYGAPVTFTACVTPNPGSGTMTFRDGANAIDSRAVGSNGCAVSTISSLAPGVHSISAGYGGASDFRSSTATPVSVTVDETDTTTTLTSSLNPSHLNYTVTFTANVSPIPSAGTVEFREGAIVLATANVVNGIAKMAATLREGSHDIVAAYIGNGGFHPSTSATLTQVVGPVSKAKSDLNGDGRSDVVLQNGATNAVAGWLMNGAIVVTGKTIANAASGWMVAATGDLDSDGKSDILMKNSATRAIAVWRMDGGTILSGSTIATPAVDWRVATAADFTGDGKADLILQNAAGAIAQWQMNGSTITLGRVIATPAPELQVITAANFAGTPGLILQNSSTGAIERWLMSGTTVTSNSTVATPATDWKVKAADDFTGDGVAELVVQNDSTAAISIWSLDSSGIFAGEHVIATPAIAWKVIGTADYDDDGRADILLRNTSDNRVAIWTTAGTTLLSGRVVATPVAGWIPVLK